MLAVLSFGLHVLAPDNLYPKHLCAPFEEGEGFLCSKYYY
jgi:hypothetical protein